MKKWLIRALYAAPVLLIGGLAWSDYTATQGTVAAYTCSSTKICPGVVLYDASTGAVQQGTTSAPLYTAPGSGQTFPVSAAALPLPAGAATQTTLAAVLSAIQAATPPGTNNIGGVVPQAGATGGALNYHHYSAATSGGDTQNVKTSAATLYAVTVTQSTTTAMELKLYNTASAPTCSSATGIVDNIPIPSNATSPGYHLTYPVGKALGTGLSFCLVAFGAPAADTDAGTPATGVTVSFAYD